MIRRLAILLCLLPALALADAHIGRLFLSPAERAALDVVRHNGQPPEKIATAGTPDAAAAAIAPVVTLHGYVKRSDDKGTVWINGRPLAENATTHGIAVGRLREQQVPISLPGRERAIHLKAGQSFDAASGRVTDNLQRLPPISRPGAAASPRSSPR